MNINSLTINPSKCSADKTCTVPNNPTTTEQMQVNNSKPQGDVFVKQNSDSSDLYQKSEFRQVIERSLEELRLS